MEKQAIAIKRLSIRAFLILSFSLILILLLAFYTHYNFNSWPLNHLPTRLNALLINIFGFLFFCWLLLGTCETVAYVQSGGIFYKKRGFFSLERKDVFIKWNDIKNVSSVNWGGGQDLYTCVYYGDKGIFSLRGFSGQYFVFLKKLSQNVEKGKLLGPTQEIVGEGNLEKYEKRVNFLNLVLLGLLFSANAMMAIVFYLTQ